MRQTAADRTVIVRKRPVGRPTLPPGEQRSVRLGVMVSQSAHQDILRLCDRYGITVSAYFCALSDAFLSGGVKRSNFSDAVKRYGGVL